VGVHCKVDKYRQLHVIRLALCNAPVVLVFYSVFLYHFSREYMFYFANNTYVNKKKVAQEVPGKLKVEAQLQRNRCAV